MRLSDLHEEFVSQAQRGYFYAKAAEGDKKFKRMAKEFEDSTPKGKKLPYHVKNAALNDYETDNLAHHFLKTKDMPVMTANALANLILKVSDGMKDRTAFLKSIQSRLESRLDPFKEKMMPGQEPYTDAERKQRDALISGAAAEDDLEDGEVFKEMGHEKRARNSMRAKPRHKKNCSCNYCMNMITQDFGVGPGGGTSDSSGFGL